MNVHGPYQFDDELSPEQMEALEADILERGCLHPVEVDEDGNVLDGHHRKAICKKHGLSYETRTIRGLTEQEKR